MDFKNSVVSVIKFKVHSESEFTLNVITDTVEKRRSMQMSHLISIIYRRIVVTNYSPCIPLSVVERKDGFKIFCMK